MKDLFEDRIFKPPYESDENMRIVTMSDLFYLSGVKSEEQRKYWNQCQSIYYDLSLEPQQKIDKMRAAVKKEKEAEEKRQGQLNESLIDRMRKCGQDELITKDYGPDGKIIGMRKQKIIGGKLQYVDF